MATRKRTAYDLSHVKSVTAVALMFDGKQAGKIVANWSDNPAGSVCTATVSVWAGPLSDLPKSTESAGGYGYDKLSSCLSRIFDGCPDAGRSSCYRWLEDQGYVVIEVC